MNAYGTRSCSGRSVRRRHRCSSVVADWSVEEAWRLPCPPPEEEVALFREVLRTDGYLKGETIELRMKVLSHKDARTPSPVVLLVPGGGFESCSFDILLLQQEYLWCNGYAVAVPEYRLVGEGLCDDALEDIAGAIAFISDEKDRYNIDPGRLALMGNSASGYLVAMAGVMKTPGVKAVIDLYGPSDLTLVAEDYEDDVKAFYRDDLCSVLTQYVNGVFTKKTLAETPKRAEALNPLSYVDGSEPPFLFMHGEEDLEVSPSQTAILHETLLGKGADSIRYSLVNAGHGGPSFDCLPAMEAMLVFLNTRL